MGVAELKAHLVEPVTQDSLKAAILAARDAILLREEAKVHLSKRDASKPDAIDRLWAMLFSPNTLCERIPMPMRRAHYQANLWRFQMPSAWRVSAIDWVCCQGRACDHPAAASCREEGAAYMARLRQELPDRIDDQAFGESFDERRPGQPRLRFKRYTFFYDADAPPHPRLRQGSDVERKALQHLAVGQLSDPVATRQGHSLLRLSGKQAPRSLAWSDPRTQALLRTELCPTLWRDARHQYLKDLSRQTPVRLARDAIEAEWGITLPKPPQ